MTQRKPRGISFETWIERQIREATDRGEFDDLPGWGKPIADLDQPRDELWWIRQKMQRENLSYLPPTLALRKEVEDGLAAASCAASEAEVRRIVTALNDKIRAANRLPPSGPPLSVALLDVESAVHDWHAKHPRDLRESEPAPDPQPSSDNRPRRRRWRWWWLSPSARSQRHR